MTHALQEEVSRLSEARFSLYRDPENSEVDDESDTLAKALKAKPSKGAEIVSNGKAMARSKDGRKWALTVWGEKAMKG